MEPPALGVVADTAQWSATGEELKKPVEFHFRLGEAGQNNKRAFHRIATKIVNIDIVPHGALHSDLVFRKECISA